jgi:hypothetical protein
VLRTAWKIDVLMMKARAAVSRTGSTAEQIEVSVAETEHGDAGRMDSEPSRVSVDAPGT